MKQFFILCFLTYLLSPILSYSFTGAYLGWENFSSPALPEKTSADSLVFGIVGNTPTRVYFYYNILGKSIFTKGEARGNLGWGLDIAGGIGYRFLNAAYKKSGWDIGMDIFGYFSPYFLNSQTGYTETALYYGLGLGLNTIYKINPFVGTGLRLGLKYNIGSKYLSSKQDSSAGIMFFIGALLTF